MRFPHRRRKIANQFEDLASAVAAGIPAHVTLEAPEGLGAVESFAASSRGIELNRVERAVFEAAERSGELPRALRDRAEHERSVMELQLETLRRLAYPMFLLFASIAFMTVLHTRGVRVSWLPLVALASMVGLALVAWWQWRRAHHQADLPALVPKWLVSDYSAVPYLAALRGLYAAGMPVSYTHLTLPTIYSV